jgi:hypothetical protein
MEIMRKRLLFKNGRKNLVKKGDDWRELATTRFPYKKYPDFTRNNYRYYCERGDVKSKT